MRVSARTPLPFQLAETSMRLDPHNSSLHKYLAMRLVPILLYSYLVSLLSRYHDIQQIIELDM